MHDDDDLDSFERIRRSWQSMSGIPVGSDSARNAARKQTAKGRRAKKRVGSNTTGLRKRRRKGGNDGR